MKKSSNYKKPEHISGVISNIEKEGPFEGKYNNNVQKMANYYLYKVSIEGKDSTFHHNLPESESFPFEEGQNVSFKAFPKKQENEYAIVHKSLAKQLTPEEIRQFINNKEQPSQENKSKSRNKLK